MNFFIQFPFMHWISVEFLLWDSLYARYWGQSDEWKWTRSLSSWSILAGGRVRDDLKHPSAEHTATNEALKEMLQQYDRWVTVGPMKKGIQAMIRHWWFGGGGDRLFQRKEENSEVSWWDKAWFIWINMAPGEESSRARWQSGETFGWHNWEWELSSRDQECF